MPEIIVVCTGNICRSPVGEILLQGYLGPDARVASAGTHAMVGHGIPDEMLAALARDGIDGSDHRAAQLTPEHLRSADLLIFMAAQHRRWALSEFPAALKRSYLLTELAAAARLGAELPGGDLATRVAGIADAIPAVRPQMTPDDVADIPDPYRRSQDDYDESYALIKGAVAAIGPWLSGR